MMNLGLGQKEEGNHKTGSENNKEREVKMEGKGYTICHLYNISRRTIAYMY